MITDRENYFQCLDTMHMPYGEVEVEWLIGQARDERDRIRFRLENPPPMDVTKIAYHDLPKSEQYFRRGKRPDCWDPKVLREIAKREYSTGKTDKQREDPNYTNFNWWRVYENMTPEMADYFDQEWDRRNNGFWFFNNGQATWMTGAHYMFVTHWWLKIGQYPNYKDRNLMDFYAWRAMEMDPSSLGLLTPKHRRSNHTTIACYLGFEYVSRTPGTHFAIQSHGEKGAKTNFRDKVVPGWARLVPFFQPLSSSGDNPEESIIMERISRTGSKKGFQHDGEDVLNSKIFSAPNGNGVKEPLDGEALHRYVRDEPGKEDALDILLQWGIMRRTLGRRAKAFFCSTRESVKAPYTDKFWKLYQQSLLSIAIDKGSDKTESGLRALFIPCYVGHSIEGMLEMFTGKHGESIVHKPDPETKAWLLENRCFPEERKRWSEIYDRGGAYEYELAQRILNNNDPAEKRRMPFTIEEVFATVNAACDFDIKMTNAAKAKLESHYKGGKSWQDHLTVRGRLEWVADIEKGDVVFVEDKNGPFLWNRRYLPVPKSATAPKPKTDLHGDGGALAHELRIWSNNVERDPPRQGREHYERHGCVRPKTDSNRYGFEDLTHIVVGMDPQKLAQIDQRAKTISKASSHGLYPYRQDIDGEWTEEIEAEPSFAEDWKTNAFIFEYIHHPKEPAVHHADMLKVAIFLNAKILFESQIPTFRDYMRQMGCAGFLIHDRAWAKDKTKSVPGLASSPYIIMKYVSRLTSWIKRFCYANKCPFPETLEQWMQMDPGDMEKFDAGVSSGYAALAAQPEELRIPTKTNNLHATPPEGQITVQSVRALLNR